MARGNVDNLIKNSDLTPDERKEKATKAGKKSGEVRAKRKLLREELIYLLNSTVTDPANKKRRGTVRHLISSKLVQKALRGDIEAFKVIRDTTGEKPTEKIDASIDSENKLILMAYLEEIKKNDKRRD